MIDVRREPLITADVECVLRSVGSDLEPLTAVGREVGAAAGEDLLERMEQIGDLPVGGAVITPAGNLSASFIVHVALRSHDEPVSVGGVRKALQNGLRHACRMDIETLALPPLGTGAGNLDAEEAADVMLEVLRGHMESEEYPREVTVMVATEYELQAFASRLEPAVD
ncbi:MAG: macro domain-containing protein [Gemmatimonadetes bacterium]|nr:macro domain-containing protein [Gemmatimonadota bacterium]